MLLDDYLAALDRAIAAARARVHEKRASSGPAPPMLLDYYLAKQAAEDMRPLYMEDPVFRAAVDEWLEKTAGRGKDIALAVLTLASAGVSDVKTRGAITPASIVKGLGGMDTKPQGPQDGEKPGGRGMPQSGGPPPPPPEGLPKWQKKKPAKKKDGDDAI